MGVVWGGRTPELGCIWGERREPVFDPILSERRGGELWEEISVLVRWGPMVAGGESGWGTGKVTGRSLISESYFCAMQTITNLEEGTSPLLGPQKPLPPLFCGAETVLLWGVAVPTPECGRPSWPPSTGNLP